MIKLIEAGEIELVVAKENVELSFSVSSDSESVKNF